MYMYNYSLICRESLNAMCVYIYLFSSSSSLSLSISLSLSHTHTHTHSDPNDPLITSGVLEENGIKYKFTVYKRVKA